MSEDRDGVGAAAVASETAASPGTAASPRLLAGGPIAAEIRVELTGDFATFKERWGYAPTLAVVLVGEASTLKVTL